MSTLRICVITVNPISKVLYLKWDDLLDGIFVMACSVCHFYFNIVSPTVIVK